MSYQSLEEIGFDNITPEGKKKLEHLMLHCDRMLGGASIPVHLESEDYAFAFQSALNTYRARSTGSIRRSYGLLKTTEGKTEYVVPKEVDVIEKINRTRGGFGGIGAAGDFESFGAATIHTLLRGVANGLGGLDIATFDALAQYQETLGRIFARNVNFQFQSERNRLLLYYTPEAEEFLLLEVSVLKTVDELLDNHWAYDWLQRYTLAVSKTVLGEKYSLINAIPGPSGGTFMKGDSLKEAGRQEIEQLLDELMDYGDTDNIPLPMRG